MPNTNTPAPSQKFDSNTLTHCLVYGGGNVGLGFPDEESFFRVGVNGLEVYWTIAETLAQLDHFDDAGQFRIKSNLAFQAQYSGHISVGAHHA